MQQQLLLNRSGGGYGEDIWYDEEEIDLRPIYRKMKAEVRKKIFLRTQDFTGKTVEKAL